MLIFVLKEKRLKLVAFFCNLFDLNTYKKYNNNNKIMEDKKQKLIDHLFNSTCGYGMAENNGFQSKFDKDGNYLPDKRGGNREGGKKAFEKCMNAIPDEYFYDFIYTLYRIADKSGADGFEIY